jgi:hypothetical protein
MRQHSLRVRGQSVLSGSRFKSAQLHPLIGQKNKSAVSWDDSSKSVICVPSKTTSESVPPAFILQTWLHNFYPDRRDILEEAHRLARELGGELRDPRFSWKYAWIEKTFGWKAAKRAQVQV